MDNFTIENVLEDIGIVIEHAEYTAVEENDIPVVIDGKLTIIAPTGQRFVVSVIEEK